MTTELAAEIGMTESEVIGAWAYLRDKGLIKTYNLAYTAKVNAAGIDAIELARQDPGRPSRNFPSVTYNMTFHGPVSNSPVQQGGRGASMNQAVSYSGSDADNLRKLIEIFDTRLAELGLDEAMRRKAAAQVATIKAQLEDEPDPVIVNQAGRTLRNITEGAIAGLIATAAQPGVWHWVQATMSSLFGS